ncbi:MAG: SDR family NAD(P)-dependent oxidoreductase [Betaproteobacteria bacterium]
MNDRFTLAGRVVLVTGAGQGVGLRSAEILAEHGARGVVVNDYHLGRAEAAAAKIESMGVPALAVQADVGSPAEVAAMFGAARAKFGRVDVLINNAGNAGPVEDTAAHMKQFWETTPDEWQVWLHTNLHGVMVCTHAALPGMIEHGYGRIVTVISDAGRFGEPHLAVYSAAKGGAASFMRAIAKAGARFGIAANCLSLGAMSTPALETRLSDPERRKKVLSHYLIRRLGTPDDAASAILYLASDAASWVTGQTIPVNGGYAFSM